MTARLARQQSLSPAVQTQIDAIKHLNGIRYTPVGSSIDMNKPRIRDMQIILFYLGYNIKCDGIWGPKTKEGIKDVFGIDCKNLFPWEAAFKVYAMHHVNTVKQVFNLQIKDATTGINIKGKVNVSEAILNDELKEFSVHPGSSQRALCIFVAKPQGCPSS